MSTIQPESEVIERNKKIHNSISIIYDKKHTQIYNEIEQHRLNETIQQLLTILGTNDEIKVLDFGAGTGNLALKFLALGCSVVAADVSEESLSLLLNKAKKYKEKIKTTTLSDLKIPFSNNYFDIVATYSVLHHIPDYLSIIQEMIRITKPNGLIFIDHEANENRWNPDKNLAEYYQVTKLTLFKHLKQLLETKELFTYAFLKTVFIKLFINSRYEREGDIHVWHDDHIEWDKIITLLNENNFELVVNNDFLLYNPNAGVELYEQYKLKCTDTKYIIARKKY